MQCVNIRAYIIATFILSKESIKVSKSVLISHFFIQVRIIKI